MFGIIKKDLCVYIGYFLISTIMPILLTIEDGFDSSIILAIGAMIPFSALSCIAYIETLEAKSRGYKVLSTLPLTSSNIVFGKILPVIGLIILWILFILVYILLFPMTDFFFQASIGFLTLCIILTLLSTIMIFMIIFRFGLSKTLNIIVYLTPFFAMFGTIGLTITFKKEIYSVPHERWLAVSSWLNIFIALVFGIALFAIFIHSAVKIKYRYLEHG